MKKVNLSLNGKPVQSWEYWSGYNTAGGMQIDESHIPDAIDRYQGMADYFTGRAKVLKEQQLTNLLERKVS